MYFFYFDESGSRDPDVGSAIQPKDHIYVLLAVGLFERKWHSFERSISQLKLELADHLRRNGKGSFDLADCEVKSNWLRIEKARHKESPFLQALPAEDLERLAKTYFEQLKACNSVLIAAVIDKRYLLPHMTAELLHKKAYEFCLERIEQFMAQNHPKHQALIVMDDNSKELNRAVAMKHAYFQRSGNQNLQFRHIVEYPFFTRSELSNGVQLADLLAYNVYRAFKKEDYEYPYFDMLWPNFYRRPDGSGLDGLKVWPEPSPLIAAARRCWRKKANLLARTSGED